MSKGYTCKRTKSHKDTDTQKQTLKHKYTHTQQCVHPVVTLQCKLNKRERESVRVYEQEREGDNMCVCVRESKRGRKKREGERE